MRPALLWIAVASMLGVACGSNASKQTPAPVAGLQATAIATNPPPSSVVVVNGSVEQGDKRVTFALRFTSVAPDRLGYQSDATTAGRTDSIGLIVIPPRAWELRNGAWQAFTPADFTPFKAARIWRLVPFDEATLVGTDTIAGAEATRYHADVNVQLPLDELAGSLIAGDLAFDGALERFAIDYWVDGSGAPVRAVYAGSGDATLQLTAEIQLSNDPSIAVTPPAP